MVGTEALEVGHKGGWVDVGMAHQSLHSSFE